MKGLTPVLLVLICVAPSARAQNHVEDEYTRYELLAPATNSFRITYDVSAVTPGARFFGERVDPAMVVVVIPFTPVKQGGSIRLRISETYTDPARYTAVSGELLWHRSFGRNRNDMVLPDGWYLTASSIPAVVTREPDGRIRLSYWNPRPDSVDVFVKARRR